MSFFDSLDALLVSQTTDRSDLSSAIKALNVACLSIAILSDHEITTHTISHSGDPVDSSTLFQACSISKPICALAVLRAVQMGKLSLTEPITTYIPEDQVSLFSTPVTAKLLRHVTLGHLLSHSSGLSVHGFRGYSEKPHPSVAEILSGSPPANNARIIPEFLPGFKFSYSGGGFTVVQLILENAFVPASFLEIVSDLVLKPLNMTRSLYSLPASETNHARAHLNAQVQADAPAHVLPELAAAGLWTTPTDLLKAVRAVQDSYFGTSNFLTRDLALKVLTEYEPETLGAGYALGWAAPKESKIFGHSGSNDPGFRCNLIGCIDIDTDDPTNFAKQRKSLGSAAGEGIAIMTNSASGYEAIGKLNEAIKYLRRWPGRDQGLGTAANNGGGNIVPLVDRRHKNGNEFWNEWTGKWKRKDVKDKEMKKTSGESDQTFEILTLKSQDDTKDGPTKPALITNFLSGTTVDLLPAAMPQYCFRESTTSKDNGQETRIGLDLVCDGLEMVLHCGWSWKGKITDLNDNEEAGARIRGWRPTVEVWTGMSDPAIELERIA